MNNTELIHLTALASYTRLEPAEDILSLFLPDPEVQSIAERLDVFHIFIFVRNMPEKTNGRTAQLKDASVQPRSQIGWRIFSNELSIFHEAHAMTA